MGSLEAAATMERRTRNKDPPISPTDGVNQDELTEEELNDFRKKDLCKQFDAVKSIEVQKLAASELNTYATAKKIVKVVTMLVVFVIVLGSTVVSKGATFLMVSQLTTSPNSFSFCPDSILPQQPFDIPRNETLYS